MTVKAIQEKYTRMKWAYRWGILFAAMVAFRWVPGLAALWQRRVALPALAGLHRGSAGVPFPILEPLALGLLCLGLGRRGWRRLMGAAWVAASLLVFLWYPGYWAHTPEILPAPEAGPLEGLCYDLIDELAASPLRFSPPYEALGNAVKAARYPEWMRGLGIAGLFSPWTGEAIVDGGASPALLPFTCVHELTHLEGVADEGEANRAAYRACIQRGGMFADSARLWALRYALPLLREADGEAARRVVLHMDATLLALLPPLEPPKPRPVLRLLGIEGASGSYNALIHALAHHIVDPDALLNQNMAKDHLDDVGKLDAEVDDADVEGGEVNQRPAQGHGHDPGVT